MSSSLLRRRLLQRPIFPITSPHRFLSSGKENKHYNVIIAGGGAVGGTLAHHLSNELPSLSVAVMDTKTPQSPQEVFSSTNTSKNSTVTPNARAYALSPNSLELLGTRVLDRLSEKGRIASYNSMQIWESDGPATLHFSTEDVQSSKNGWLGAVVEDEPLVSILWDEMRKQKDNRVEFLSPATLKIISIPKQGGDNRDAPVQISYQEGENVVTATADLLIAADGANSFVRRSLGIFPTSSFGYGRKAVTCTVELESSIHATAFQRFQPNGPLALLPVWDENAHDKTFANIVWSTTPEEALALQNLSEAEFVQRMNDLLQTGPVNGPSLASDDTKRFMPLLGSLESLLQSANAGLSLSGWNERQRGFKIPPKISAVVGGRFSFDLNLMHARNYVGPRVALVGDAAHTVHPMAGQGLNLGMGDAQSLVKNIKHIFESGMGTKGNAGVEYALKQYESERQREVLATMTGIQFLHEAFSTTVAPAVHIRSLGMNLLNLVGPVRKQLAKVATGDTKIFGDRNLF